MSSEDKTVEPSDQGPSLPSVSAGATSTGSPAQTDKRPRGRPRKDAATTIVPQAPPTTTSKTRKKGRTRGRVVVEEEDSSMDGTEAAASESPLRTTTVTWPLVEEPARQSRCDSLGEVLDQAAFRDRSFVGFSGRGPSHLFTPHPRPSSSVECPVMEVKGQMIHVPESSTLMFLGSPRVDKLEELMGSGLYLSDIPIHDATRDVILVGQQAKAQDGLNNRMDKLKATLEKTHQALEEEKRRTVDLLYSIFPGDVAQKLWQGESVPARKFDDVTMLFSDIVGFTAVCAQCTPMQVISMLNELYTIETIGDAYCVAGGLHQKIDSHAKPIALMALKMMELSEEVLTPDSKSIKNGDWLSFKGIEK
nr:guanylate cyclase soluble subunit alpha-2-like [Salvelinus alpinus]